MNEFAPTSGRRHAVWVTGRDETAAVQVARAGASQHRQMKTRPLREYGQPKIEITTIPTMGDTLNICFDNINSLFITVLMLLNSYLI